MPTLGQVQYYKTPGANGQFPYSAVPWGGNVPQGYTPVGKDEYANFIKGVVQKGYLNAPGDQNIDLFKKTYNYNDLVNNTGMFADNYVQPGIDVKVDNNGNNPDYKPFAPNAPVPMKFYKNSQGTYDFLPGYNTPYGATPVSDISEINSEIAKWSAPQYANDSWAQHYVQTLKNSLSSYNSGQSNYVTDEKGNLTTKDAVAQQQQQNQNQNQNTTTPYTNFPSVALQPGASGDSVKQLQDFLVKNGFMSQADVNTGYGTYGPRTTAAVQALQEKLGVDNSSGVGYFGPKTLAALQKSSGGTTVDNNQNGGNSGNQNGTNQNGSDQQQPQSPTDFITTYKNIISDLGLSDIKNQYQDWVQKQQDITNEMNDKIAEINDNPWLVEGVRTARIQKLKDSYQTKMDVATHTLTLLDSLYKEGLDQAQFLATGQAKQSQDAIDNAQKAADAQAKLSELDTQVVEAGGRKLLINSKTGEVVADLGTSGSVGGSQLVKSGGLAVSESQISKNQQALNSSRGDDGFGMGNGYANSKTYLDMYNNWVHDNNGLADDFFKYFPPKDYLNPGDTSIPKFIRDKISQRSV